MSEEKEIREEVTENTEMAENKESVEETVETIDPCEVLKKESVCRYGKHEETSGKGL